MAQRLNRSAVVASAAQLADEVGLEALTITKVGHALGIAPPGVYRHVSDITDLRRAIGQAAAREVSAELARACAGLSGRPALSALAHTLRNWARRYPARYVALQIAPDPDDGPGIQAADQLLTVIASALQAYELTGSNLTDAIRLIRSALHGFIDLERNAGFKQARSTEQTFERMIESLDLVLQHWAS